MNKIQETYKILRKAHGPQGWWPIINNKTLLCEYHLGAPRNDAERLEITFGAILTQGTQWYPNVVRAIQQLKLGREFTKKELEVIKEAEISNQKILGNAKVITKGRKLTQNTSWKNVERSIVILNKNKLISPQGIIAIPKSKLAEVIRSSGYYNQKGEKLKIIAKFLYYTETQQLEQLDTKELRELLLKIKGIGPETADSIILYAFSKPIFVIDAYTKRIFSRIGLLDENAKYEDIQDFFHRHLNMRKGEKIKDKEKTKLFNEYHALIVEHAKRYCKVKPRCEECILRRSCKYGKKNR